MAGSDRACKNEDSDAAPSPSTGGIRHASGEFDVGSLLRGARCLIVEDVPLVAAQQARALAALGCAVSIAGSVNAALQALRQQPFELVLVDLGLPDGDGLVIARFAKTLDPSPGVAVVTGTTDELRKIALQEERFLHASKDGGNVLVRVAEAALRQAAAAAFASVDVERVRGAPSPQLSRALNAYASHFALSPLETDVLRHGFEGLTSKEIAGRLSLATGTVDALWSRISVKIGVDGKVRIAADSARLLATQA